jgi:hypothetical protein
MSFHVNLWTLCNFKRIAVAATKMLLNIFCRRHYCQQCDVADIISELSNPFRPHSQQEIFVKWWISEKHMLYGDDIKTINLCVLIFTFSSLSPEPPPFFPHIVHFLPSFNFPLFLLHYHLLSILLVFNVPTHIIFRPGPQKDIITLIVVTKAIGLIKR